MNALRYERRADVSDAVSFGWPGVVGEANSWRALNSRNEWLRDAEVQLIFVKPSKLPTDLKFSFAPPKFSNVSAVKSL